MRRKHPRESIRTTDLLQHTTLPVVILLLACAATVGAENDAARQKAYLRSLVPQVDKPSPTPEQNERGFLAYWARPTTNFYANIPPTHVVYWLDMTSSFAHIGFAVSLSI